MLTQKTMEKETANRSRFREYVYQKLTRAQRFLFKTKIHTRNRLFTKSFTLVTLDAKARRSRRKILAGIMNSGKLIKNGGTR